MPRRPQPTPQLSLNLNAPSPDVMVPDEAIRALADLLLEAVGALRSDADQGDDLAPVADSDESGRGFRHEGGPSFRFESGPRFRRDAGHRVTLSQGRFGDLMVGLAGSSLQVREPVRRSGVCATTRR